MRRTSLLLLVALPWLRLSADAAWAQGLDYGQYEALFGEPVTSSATGKPERVSDTPILMELITAEDIKRSGARDIPSLLGRLAGIDVVHGSSGMADLGIGGYIRPLTSRIMVLINGRQVYYDGFGEVLWPTLAVEMAEIRQIEVIKGSQSALYGFNAVDGVVNIVTFDPIADPVNSLTARLGNQARRDLTASVTQPLGGEAGVRLTAGTDHAQDTGMVTKTSTNTAYAKDPNRRSVSLDAAANLPGDGRARLEASHTDVSARTIASNTFFDARVVTDSIKGSYSTESAIGRLDGTVYYTVVDMPWVEAQPVGSSHNSDGALVGQLSDLLKVGTDDSLRFGLEARRNAMTSAVLQGGTVTGDLSAASAMWDHQWSPRFSMVNSARYDYFKLGRSGVGARQDIFSNDAFDRSLEGVSANSALIGKVTADDSVRLSFARGVKLPSLANFGILQHYLPQYSGSPNGLNYYENPDLATSVVYDYRIGWDHHIDAVDATARVAAFHDITTKSIGTANLVTGKRVTAILETMVPGWVSNGVELDLRHKVRDGWTWGGNYTFDRLHEHSDGGLRDAFPEHKINLNVGYALNGWDADLYGSYVSATKGVVITPGTPPTAAVGWVKSHYILSPHIGWQARDNLRVELAAENLWPYQDSLPQRMETSYYLSVTVSY
ncbi:MAG TPA: TonB-dependent receptor plug domain-containing protein [Telmatospirillum sp.]|nr:TonB-dependent receptor plug domain-containing protein [Telmatospirillum sp.]